VFHVIITYKNALVYLQSINFTYPIHMFLFIIISNLLRDDDDVVVSRIAVLVLAISTTGND